MAWRDDGTEEPLHRPCRGWDATEGLGSVGGGTDADYCRVADCERPVNARGLCAVHYARLVRGGSLLDEILPARTPWDRLYDALGELWRCEGEETREEVRIAESSVRWNASAWALSLGWTPPEGRTLH